MKLIYCPHCFDVVKLRVEELRYCYCKKSWGMYVDRIKAVCGGQCIPMGINNYSMDYALSGHLVTIEGWIYEATQPITMKNWEYMEDPPELV